MFAVFCSSFVMCHALLCTLLIFAVFCCCFVMCHALSFILCLLCSYHMVYIVYDYCILLLCTCHASLCTLFMFAVRALYRAMPHNAHCLCLLYSVALYVPCLIMYIVYVYGIILLCTWNASLCTLFMFTIFCCFVREMLHCVHCLCLLSSVALYAKCLIVYIVYVYCILLLRTCHASLCTLFMFDSCRCFVRAMPYCVYYLCLLYSVVLYVPYCAHLYVCCIMLLFCTCMP